MNIEQLEKGKELRKKIEELNLTQKQLIENYKSYTEENVAKTPCSGIKPGGVSISFRLCENNKVVCIPLDKFEKMDVFNMLNNSLMKKITSLEKEFSEL